MKQLSFFESKNISQPFLIQVGRRKIRRPLCSKRPIHLILKSRAPIRRNERAIVKKWNQLTQRFGVKTYKVVVASDHLHAIIKIHSRNLYRQFIRALTGLLARALRIKWLYRPVTRIAHWGKDFRRLLQYLTLNEFEASGHLAYQSRRTREIPEWLVL